MCTAQQRLSIGVFFSNKLNVFIVDENVLKSDCVNISLKISKYDTSETFILGVIYRHAERDLNNFFEALYDKLGQIGNKKFYLLLQ